MTSTKCHFSRALLFMLLVSLPIALYLEERFKPPPEIIRELDSGDDHLETGWTSNRILWFQSSNSASNITYSYTTENRLMAINASTGSVLWDRRMDEAELGVTALLNVGSFVYTVTATDAHAYDASTGVPVWSTHLGDGHVSIYLQADAHKLRVYYGDRIIELSTETGQVLRDTPNSNILWIHDNLEIDLAAPTSGCAMMGIDATTSRQLWASPGPTFLRFENFPIQALDSTLFVLNSERGICALSLASGKYLWCRSEKYLSNLGLDSAQSIGYAVDQNFELKKIDLESGALLASTQFRPQELPSDMRSFGYVYTVSVTKDDVIVSFGDSSQTFGLKILSQQLP